MRHILSLLFILIFTIKGSSQETKTQKINFKKEGYQKAVVINEQIDGCGLMIKLSDKQKSILRPQQLREDLAIAGTKVWIKFTYPKKELPNTCMRGKEIIITDIRKR